MNRKLIVCLLILTLAASAATAQTAEPYKATLAVRMDQPRWIVNRNLYGQFAEHLGLRDICKGVRATY